MHKVKIIGDTKQIFDKSQAETIQKFIFENSCHKISVSFDMIEYIPDILEITGEEYKSRINISAKLDPGSISLSARGGLEMIVEMIILDYGGVDTKHLNEEIIMQSPSYLVMNNNTLYILSKFCENDIDEYDESKSAYYHSYRKIPIARSEFLPTGIIELVK